MAVLNHSWDQSGFYSTSGALEGPGGSTAWVYAGYLIHLEIVQVCVFPVKHFMCHLQ